MDVVMIVIWVLVLVGTVIFEICTEQFVSIWFSLSSLVSILLAGFGAPRWVQISVFVAVAVILLIATRPLVKKLKKEPIRTNFDMNIGKTALITEPIHNQYSNGRATIGGVSWIAVSADGSAIDKGETVRIIDISGAKLIVSKLSS